MANSRFVS